MIRRPPRSTLFPTRRSSDLDVAAGPCPASRPPERRGRPAHRLAEPGPRGVSERPRRSGGREDRKSTRLNSSHSQISYAVFCLKKKKIVNCILLYQHNSQAKL